MNDPVLQGAGKHHTVAAVKVIAFYQPDTGRILHMHSVITLKGATTPTSEAEAIQQALRQAQRAGLETAHLHHKVSSNYEHAMRPHRVDIATGEFVPLSHPGHGFRARNRAGDPPV